MKFLKDPMYQGLLIAVLITIISFWIYLTQIEQENYWAIDNPTNATLEINLSGDKIVLGPYQTIEMELQPGEYEISTKTKDSIYPNSQFTIGNEVRGLINPTNSQYIIYSRFYGTSTNKDSLLAANKSRIDGKVIFGKVAETNNVYNKDFYLNVNQHFPNYIKKRDTLTYMSKIFRKDNFEKFYAENYN